MIKHLPTLNKVAAYLYWMDSKHTLGVSSLRCTHILLKEHVSTERNNNLQIFNFLPTAFFFTVNYLLA